MGRDQLTALSYRKLDGVSQMVKLELVDGKEFDWEIANPNLLLAQTLEDNEGLRKLYVEALETKPCTREEPWNLMVIFDEYTPGGIAFPQLDRKTMDLAFNLLEICAEALSVTATWLVPVAARAKKN